MPRPQLAAGLSLALLASLGLGLIAPAADADDAGVRVPELGDPSLAELVLVGTAEDGLSTPRDLAFNPDRPEELWTVNRADDSTVIYVDPGQPEQRIDKRIDVYAYHFMEEVSAISFGAGDTFATCQESRNTYNDQARANDFMGPTLWPADLDLYAKANQGGGLRTPALLDAIMRGQLCGLEADPDQADRCTLGSHIDMNHQSPNCMGIEHQADNAYWTVDGFNGHIVYYDFAADHGLGCDDHSDGIVRRYPEASVIRVPGVPSHLALDAATGWLYYADTGAGEVRRLDSASGRRARDLGRSNEPLAEYSAWSGVTVETFATGLQAPSGLALGDGRLFVSDYATGEILAFDLETGDELARLATGAEGIMGLALGPDARLWFVDGLADRLLRVDPHAVPPTPSPSPSPEPTLTPTATATPERFQGFLPWLQP